MTGIWSTIKAAVPAPDQRHEAASHAMGTSNSSTPSQPSQPPRILGTTSSQSLPRPSSSVDARGIRSQASTPQSPNHGHSSPSRPSRPNTNAAPNEKGKSKDRESQVKDADGAGTPANTVLGTGNGTGSGVDVARTAAPAPSQAHPPAPSPAIDPVSQQIFMRKSTEPSIPQRLTQMAEGLARASSDLSTKNAAPVGEAPRDKRKGNSFLSRFGMRGGRKKELGDIDSDSELGSEARMDGATAHVFSQSMTGPLVGGGYIPHHKEPPRYIRTRASNKRTREFNRMFLAQELVGTRPPATDGDSTTDANGKAPVVTVSVAGASDRKTERTGGAIWATEFSKDGKYLATGGRDHVVRIWAVLSTPEERGAHGEEEAAHDGAGERLSAPVFRDQPIKEFQGHTGEILDLSWSKNNFLLSSSMDKTVRLWHVSRPECLCTFKHKDFVTRLAFHPRDDRFFLAGSLDTMLRLWSIPDKAVAFSAQLPDLVTAVAFSPDGKVAIAGLLNGLCMFYETEGLKLSTQIHVRSSRGKNAKGSKITGIQTMVIPPPSPIAIPSSKAPSVTSTSRPSTPDLGDHGEVRVLVTSNDSRIRIYSLRDKTLDLKLKGHENLSSQIAATFSDDGKYVICGSEDRKAFIWSLTSRDALVQDKDKSPCEYFEAHGEIVTTAVFAPTKTRMLLGESGDPIYDLCNPPPVVLQSLEEAASAAPSQVALSANDSQKPVAPEPVSKRPEPSAAYIARSTHYDGNIVVTTADTGIIKVFRQDCAFAKRRHESWETGSTLSRKLTAHGGGYVAGGLGRSVSVLTRTSAGSTAHSRRGSLSQSIAPGVIGSPQLGPTGVHSDRILSWRQAIDNSSDKRASGLANGGGTPARSERSLSPAKASRTSLHSAANFSTDARKQPYFGSPPARNRADSAVTSTTVSVFSSPSERAPPRALKEKARPRERQNSSTQDDPSVPPTPSFTFRPADEDSQPEPDASTASGSLSFWNLSRWRGITGFKAGSSSSAPGQGAAGARARSNGSRASISKASISKPRPQTTTTEGSIDEAGVEDEASDRGRASSRRQSVGVLPIKGDGDGAKGDRRKSVTAKEALQGQKDGDPDSVDGGAAVNPAGPARVNWDGSPFRKGNRGQSNGGRKSAELNGGFV